MSSAHYRCNVLSEYLAEHAAIESGRLGITLELAEHRSDFPHDSEDGFLAEFEAREEAQLTDMVRKWVEEAEFSPYERVVYEFDLRIGTDFSKKPDATKAAARALNVEPVTVRVLRCRYRNKFRKVAEPNL